MQAQTIERTKAAAGSGPAEAVAVLGAVALAAATAWFALVDKAVTVPAAPRPAPNASEDDVTRGFFQWLGATYAQERWYTLIAVVGFAAVAAVAAMSRATLAGDRTPARAGSVLVGAGAALWGLAGVGEIGAHKAVGLMSTHTNPIETVSSIAFTVDTITDTLFAAAFALLGAGMLGLAAAARSSVRRAWAGYTAIVGVLLVAAAGAFATDSDLTDVALFALGIVALPVWVTWAARAATRRP